MDIRPIRTDADHEAALRDIERLWALRPARLRGTNSTCSRRWLMPTRTSDGRLMHLIRSTYCATLLMTPDIRSKNSPKSLDQSREHRRS